MELVAEVAPSHPGSLFDLGQDIVVEADLDPCNRSGHRYLDGLDADDQADKKTEKLNHN